MDLFGPDLIYIWNARNLTRQVLATVERLGTPVVYYLAGYWPTLPDEFTGYWQARSPVLVKRWLKRLAAIPALAMLRAEAAESVLTLQSVHAVSHAVLGALRQAGIHPGHARVIYNGVDLQGFFGQARQRVGVSAPLRVLCASRLTSDKGLDTLVELFEQLGVIEDAPPLAITVAGDGPADMVTRLHRAAASARRGTPVAFVPALPRNEVPELLAQHDVLVFPSREEAMPRMVQESMAAGMAVVGTTAGGTAELLREGETGLTFAIGDSDGLLRQLRRLTAEPELLSRVARQGQAEVCARHSITRMIDEIEADLKDIVIGTHRAEAKTTPKSVLTVGADAASARVPALVGQEWGGDV